MRPVSAARVPVPVHHLSSSLLPPRTSCPRAVESDSKIQGSADACPTSARPPPASCSRRPPRPPPPPLHAAPTAPPHPRAVSYCEGLLPPQYTGYAVELFRATAARLGWTADLLDWRCLPLREMVPSLANGSCDAGVGLRQVGSVLATQWLPPVPACSGPRHPATHTTRMRAGGRQPKHRRPRLWLADVRGGPQGADHGEQGRRRHVVLDGRLHLAAVAGHRRHDAGRGRARLGRGAVDEEPGARGGAVSGDNVVCYRLPFVREWAGAWPTAA